MVKNIKNQPSKKRTRFPAFKWLVHFSFAVSTKRLTWTQSLHTRYYHTPLWATAPMPPITIDSFPILINFTLVLVFFLLLLCIFRCFNVCYLHSPIWVGLALFSYSPLYNDLHLTSIQIIIPIICNV